MKARRWPVRPLAALAVLVAALAAVSLCLGPGRWDSPMAVAKAIGDGEGVAVWQIRMPRMVLAILVGASLALSGALMQALFRNPMADPFVLAISPGAGLGAVLVMLMGVRETGWGIGGVTLGAMAGAGGAAALVYGLARRGGLLPPGVLLLTGLAVGGIATALMTLGLLRLDSSSMRSTLGWLLGTLAYRGWEQAAWLAPVFAAGLAGSVAFARMADAMALGEETAHALGVEVDRARLFLMAAACVLAAATVATCGAIGFVGLMAPHLARTALGASHRGLLPGAALTGASILLAGDLASRALIPGQEIPVGVVTGVLGGVFFLLLLRRATPF